MAVLPHPSSFEAEVPGASGEIYRLRFDFEALFNIEDKLNGVSPMQLVTGLASMIVPLRVCLVLVHEGQECYRKHKKESHLEVTEASAKRALMDIGIKRLCEAVARPLGNVYQLTSPAGAEEGEVPTESVPTNATPGGVASSD
jgi:hypothetical protein